MIDLMNHIRFEGTDILFYGGLGYFMFMLIMVLAIIGAITCIRLLLNFHRYISAKLEQ